MFRFPVRLKPHTSVVVAFAALLLFAGAGAPVIAAPSGATANVRQRILLDADWRLYKEPTVTHPGQDWGAQVTGWQWRKFGTGTPPTDAATLGALAVEANAGDWQPAAIGQDLFAGQPGYAWVRAVLPATTPRPAGIHFEGFDDNGTVFLNGVMIGERNGYDTPLDVVVGSAWRTGEPNTISVLIQNTGGPGGLSEPVYLRTGVQPSVPQASLAYNDSTWRVVHLPNDYVVEGKFDPHGDASHGFLPKPTAWYRKSFVVPVSDRGLSAWVDFEGVYRDSDVWINGHYLGEHLDGYTGFRYNVAPYLRYGARNVLAVHVDPSFNEGWWYEGGGIYRHVWLNFADPVHAVPDGIFVAPKVSIVPKGATALIEISTTVANAADTAKLFVLRSIATRPDGRNVGTAAAREYIPGRSTLTVSQSIREPRAALWSLNDPQLYTLTTEISIGPVVVDRNATLFGLRTVRFDPNRGFFLNGKHVEIKGTCNHQDFAGVGIALPDTLLAWRIEQLKKMGCNAYRTSHNEVAPELLDACDRLGMLVMDETRHFGDAIGPKSPPGTTATSLSDFKSQILRDRNHPSVIMWSIANEEPLQGTPEGSRIAEAMKRVETRLDGTRPVTAAMNGGWGGDGIWNVLDLGPFNYSIWAYDQYHAQYPNKPLFGSETSSDVSTRGEYADNAALGYVRAYDTEYPTVGWGNSAEDAWAALATRPFMAGGFVWTGFDYRGEPTPYSWPDVNSNFGIMDLCGFPKDNYYYYRAWWGNRPIVHILPHWNWPGKEGTPISVWVYSNAAEVELFLNGKSLGLQDMPKYRHLEWSVPYEPGTLRAVGYTDGKAIAQDIVTTTGAPAAIRLRAPDAAILHANGEDAAVVMVDIVDAQGRVVPTAGNLVHFAVGGDGHLDGVGNGDPSDHEPNKSSRRLAFNGHCAAIIQTNEGGHGPIYITATSPGLIAGRLTLGVK